MTAYNLTPADGILLLLAILARNFHCYGAAKNRHKDQERFLVAVSDCSGNGVCISVHGSRKISCDVLHGGDSVQAGRACRHGGTGLRGAF